MASSLFKNNQPQNNRLSDLIRLTNEIKRNGPEVMFNQMYNSNPEFRQFVDNNKGKSPEQIARENNIRI